ncbi:MAG: choice-of-anchor J domain-containing protein [Prevotella sp.]
MKQLLLIFCFLMGAIGIAAGQPPTGAQLKFSPTVNNPFKRIFNAESKLPSKQIRPLKTDETENPPTLYGIIGTSDGFYLGSFPASNNLTVTKLYENNKLAATGGAIFVNDKLYVNQMTSDGIYNTTTQYIFRSEPSWKLIETRENLPYSSSATCLTYDATTDLVYGQFYNEETSEMCWGTLDLNSGESSLHGTMDDVLVAIAASPDGKIYGVNSNGMFMEIGKSNGSVRRIGHTDVKPAYMQSAVIDQQTGKFYWAAYTDTSTSGLYEVDINTGKATLISRFANNEEVVGLFMKTPALSSDVPAEPTNVSLNFDGGALEGNISFHTPSLTVGGETLNGQLTAHVMMDGKNYSQDVEPDADCTISLTASGEGYHNAYVWVSNENGASKKVLRQAWLGDDTPLPVTNIQLENVEGKAQLSWDAPEGGVHGGYVNVDSVTYTILRYPDNTIIEGYTGTTLTQDIELQTLSNLSYRIIPVYKGKRGEAANSSEVLFGDAYSVPANIAVGNSSVFSLCTVIDNNNDGVTWTWYYGGAAQYNGKKAYGRAADDWIITPAIRLQKEKYYKVTFPIFGRNALYFPQYYDLWIGQGTTVESMTHQIAKDTLQESSSGMKFIERSAMVSVDEDGLYNFGFHTTTSSYMDFMLQAIKVEETCATTSPEATKDLTLTPGENGALTTRIDFTAPQHAIDGTELTGLGKIEIARQKNEYYNGLLLSSEWVTIHTIDNPIPGEQQTYTDNEAVQGDNIYRVVAYDTDNYIGKDTTASVYCGVDIPSAPTNATLTEAEGGVMFTWDAPQIGGNGGYIDTTKLSYTVLEPQYGTVIGDDLKEKKFFVNAPEYDNMQYVVSLLVGANNAAGFSNSVAASNSVIIGKPFVLPVVENFPNHNLNYYWFLSGPTLIGEDAGWNTTTAIGVDNESGYAYFQGLSGDNQRLISSKITLKDAASPTLRFFVKGHGEDIDSLNVEITSNYNEPYTQLLTITPKDVNDSTWTSFEIPLDDWVEQDYVHVAFNASANSNRCGFSLDNISLRDVLPYDVEAKMLNVDKEEIKVSDSNTVSLQAVVENCGSENIVAKDYHLDFVASGKTIASVEGINLKPYERQICKVNWKPNLETADDIAIKAVAIYDADQDLSNNTTDSVSLMVRKPFAPAVTLLTGEEQSGTLHLSWTAPNLNGLPSERVTDDFESYRNQAINQAGDWTIWDRDSLPTTTSYYYFPKMGSEIGYIVMNVDEIIYDLNQTPMSDICPAHSGSTMLASFAAVGGDNDDWLITPELSSSSQTISFWAKTGVEEYGHEMIEILYSNTDTAPSSFTALTQKTVYVPAEWTELSYNVPAGAKYFAVHCISHNRQALFIDDFNYECAPHPLEVKFIGYNVYCDGEKLNSEPLSQTQMDVANPKDGQSFTVKVVYDLGESASSNVYTYVSTGIESLNNNNQYQGELYDLQGRKVKSATISGVYIHNGKKVIKK